MYNQNPNYYYNGYPSYYPQLQQQQQMWGYQNPNANMMNPQQQMVSSQPQRRMIFEYVNGVEEAKSYRLNPNESAVFFDTGAPYAYTKSTDHDGKSETHAFQLTEIPLDEIGKPKIDLSGYVTKEEAAENQRQLLTAMAQMEQRMTGEITKISLMNQPVTSAIFESGKSNQQEVNT
jgi:hypothetical protein